MTFGTEWGWGCDEGEAKRIFDAYVDRGGNFIDTAVNYTNGSSEKILGRIIKDKRGRIVLSTKFTMAREQGNPNSGGNHRYNLVRSVVGQFAPTRHGSHRTSARACLGLYHDARRGNACA
ncbi:aldo/keto reductase [Sodalis glossinidius]|uniref:aldo/keto reductase n=1 Tax=Sodalis glossinidius TaxID=63612 RepID=UPI00243502B3|nr:aldo/keto reductase [Sodalis glossinidius]